LDPSFQVRLNKLAGLQDVQKKYKILCGEMVPFIQATSKHSDHGSQTSGVAGNWLPFVAFLIATLHKQISVSPFERLF
jgi:hypothetical protein